MSEPIPDALRDRLRDDNFGRLLGARLIELQPGYALMALELTEAHMGTPGVTHGGAVFALAEAALAAATHAFNRIHLALNVNIVYHATTRPGDRITAEVLLRHEGGRTATYAIDVRDQDMNRIASLQAVVYRTKKPLVDLPGDAWLNRRPGG